MTFSARIKDAMLTQGVTPTPQNLVRLCKGTISRQTAENWLNMPAPRLSTERFLMLAKCLKVRVTWLGEGTGPMSSITEEGEKAIDILSRMSAASAKKWLRLGEEMVE
jgi:hypothetical protein